MARTKRAFAKRTRNQTVSPLSRNTKITISTLDYRSDGGLP
jgi:hypothetical protein